MTPLKWNSEDSKICKRGHNLLDSCKSLDFLIVNGRKTGDIFGKYTSIQWNGSSVVDYVLTSPKTFDQITYFKVGNFYPWFSDHCPISYKVKLRNTMNPEGHTIPASFKEAPPTYFWSPSAKAKFEETLKSNSIKTALEGIINNGDERSQDQVSQLSETLVNCACDHVKKNSKTSNRENNNPPWFDKECAYIKNNLRKLAKDLKRFPHDNNIRKALYGEKRKLRNSVKNKKMSYKASLLDKMHQTNPTDSKTFWKLLGKMTPNTHTKNKLNGNINFDEWVNHYKSIFNSGKEIQFPENPSDTGPLDYDITLEEMMNAAPILKSGKSPGPDSITYEMIFCTLQHYPKVMLHIFNKILEQGGDVPSWTFSILVPIFKKGDVDDPSNYRGISLISCLAKFFYSIMNKRLLAYSIKKCILHPSQLGFLPGNRTSDAHMILYNLISKYCHKNDKKIFGCFVDFSKAFDCIPRDILLTKLIDQGVTGKFFSILENIYKYDKACVKIDGKLSSEFKIHAGVRQGCIMSPLLFNIFLSDLPEKLHQGDKVSLSQDVTINCLIWADDVLILSETEDGLHSSLQKLNVYCKSNGLTVNTDKTKIMIFNKTGRLIRGNYYLENEKIENVRSYKYLGLIFTPSGEIKSALDDLRSRALKAYMGMRQKLAEVFSRHIEETTKIFDTLIKPILLYSSDFWGCLKLPVNNPIENLHMMFCKHLLGVHKSSTNDGVLLEIGRLPLVFDAQKAAVKNWERIHNSRANYLCKISYIGAQTYSLNWLNLIKASIAQNGLGNYFINQTVPPNKSLYKIYYNRLKDAFIQRAFATITQPNSKLRTYSLIKEKIGIEGYLISVRNTKQRISLSKFRLSNHKLMIEVGRHQKLQKNERLCPFCLPGHIEDEIHFLTQCKLYNIIRKPLFDKSAEIKPNIQYYTDTEQFKFIMSCSILDKEVAKFIHQGMDMRAIAIENV